MSRSAATRKAAGGRLPPRVTPTISRSPAADASSDLYLRYWFEGPSASGEGSPRYATQTVHVGPLEAGRRRVLTLDVPGPDQPQ